jgi:hypothetical protein
MPTYKIGPLSVQGKSVYDARRPVECERCHGLLGVVWAVGEYSRLPAARLLRKWPELEAALRRHEAVCQPHVACASSTCLASS